MDTQLFQLPWHAIEWVRHAKTTIVAGPCVRTDRELAENLMPAGMIVVADVSGQGRYSSDDERIAAQIVHRVNCYDDLLAALDHIANKPVGASDASADEVLDGIVAMARAAIAKAEERT